MSCCGSLWLVASRTWALRSCLWYWVDWHSNGTRLVKYLVLNWMLIEVVIRLWSYFWWYIRCWNRWSVVMSVPLMVAVRCASGNDNDDVHVRLTRSLSVYNDFLPLMDRIRVFWDVYRRSGDCMKRENHVFVIIIISVNKWNHWRDKKKRKSEEEYVEEGRLQA